MRCKTLFEISKYYMEQTSICGFQYLTQDGRTFIERLFWLIVLAGCFCANYRLTKLSYYAYQYHAVSFVTETDYLHWNTSFPQIVICETESLSKIPTSVEFVMKHYPEFEADFSIASVVHDVVFNSVCSQCSRYCADETKPFCDINFNFKELGRKVKLPCEKLMKNCVWNGRPFDCCSKFETVDTERGVCFSANPSVAQFKPPIMVANKHTGPSGIEFKVTRPVEVFLLAPDDLPNYNTGDKSILRTKKSSLCQLFFTVKEMINDDALVNVDFEQRKCKFPHETESMRFDRYSQSACIVDCRANHQLRLCNCTHPNIPKSESTMCNAQGLACLHDNYVLLKRFRLKRAAYRPGIECDCPSSCVEPEYNVVYKECSKKMIRDRYGSFKIQMAGLPIQRFKRNLIRIKLDLFVSIGGITGLFLGASLLSAAEILIIFCVRPFSKRFSYK